MRLQNHAIIELELSGLSQEDPVLAQSLLSTIAVFESYGHCRKTSAKAADILIKLLQEKPLSPPTDHPDEWVEVTDIFGGPERLWQNTRDTDAYSTDGGLTWYYYYEDRFVDGDIIRTLHNSEMSEETQAEINKVLYEQLELPFPKCDCES